MIEYIKTTTIICDCCGKTRIFHKDKTYSIYWARKNGWSIGNKVRCSDCARSIRISAEKPEASQ